MSEDEGMVIERVNLQTVKKAIKKDGAKWKPKENEIVAKLTPDERLRLLGADPPPGVTMSQRSAGAKSRTPIKGALAPPPRKHDWRNYKGKNYVAPVHDQGTCGSCVSFGVCAAAEGVYRVHKQLPDDPIDLSEAHLFYCHGAQEGRDCESGWWPDRALNWFQKAGVVPDSCFPYTPGNQPCAPCENPNPVHKITGWRVLTKPSDMKDSIIKNGPLITCYEIFEDFYFYAEGVYRHVEGESLGGHCVACVGFDDTQKAWICKNSWGAAWGVNGYFLIAYGDCGIDFEMWEIASLV